MGHPPPPPLPIIFYISLEREFIEESDSFRYRQNISISRLYEQFWQNNSAMATEKNFELIKYEHIIYHFKGHDLEITLIKIVSRNI